MCSFLKGRMLWHYCTGAITIPVKGADEEDAAFLVAWLNGIVTTTWSSHGFETLPFPPSPTCWAVWWCKVSVGYVGQKVLHYSWLHEISVSGWITLTQARTRAIHQWLLWSALLHFRPNWPFWSNLGMLKGCSTICFHQRWISPHEFLMSLHKNFEPIRGQLLNRSPALSLDTIVNEVVREEARLTTLQAQNKLNVLAITPSAPPIEQPQQSGDSSSFSNRHKQTNKKFCNYCKCPDHTIETCYCRNKSTAAIANTEPTLPITSISAES